MIPAIPAITSSIQGLSATQGIQGALSLNTPAAASAATPSGSSFSSMLTQAVDALQTTQVNAQSQAIAVASGTGNVADATVAAAQASLETQLAVQLRNSVTTAFNQVMSTPF